MSLETIAQEAWETHTPRTLATGTPVIETVPDEIAQAIWTYSSRTLTTVVLIVRPNATVDAGDFSIIGQATLHEALNDEDDLTYAESATGGTPQTVEFLEGTTVRASRTLTPTGTLAVASFTLTAPELASITDWSDIRLRITDGGTPMVVAFPLLATPAGDVTIKLKIKAE